MRNNERRIVVLINTGDEYWDDAPVVIGVGSLEEAIEVLRADGCDVDVERIASEWEEHHFVSDVYDEEWEVGYADEMEW